MNLQKEVEGIRDLSELTKNYTNLLDRTRAVVKLHPVKKTPPGEGEAGLAEIMAEQRKEDHQPHQERGKGRGKGGASKPKPAGKRAAEGATPNKDFYLSAEFAQVLQKDVEWLEGDHHYIQRLFPTEGRSQYNGDAVPMCKEEKTWFGSAGEGRTKSNQALDLMLQFYGMRASRERGRYTVKVVSEARVRAWKESPHNFLRITRILTFLCLTGRQYKAEAFVLALYGAICYRGNVLRSAATVKSCIEHWMPTVDLENKDKFIAKLLQEAENLRAEGSAPDGPAHEKVPKPEASPVTKPEASRKEPKPDASRKEPEPAEASRKEPEPEASPEAPKPKDAEEDPEPEASPEAPEPKDAEEEPEPEASPEEAPKPDEASPKAPEPEELAELLAGHGSVDPNIMELFQTMNACFTAKFKSQEEKLESHASDIDFFKSELEKAAEWRSEVSQMFETQTEAWRVLVDSINHNTEAIDTVMGQFLLPMVARIVLEGYTKAAVEEKSAKPSEDDLTSAKELRTAVFPEYVRGMDKRVAEGVVDELILSYGRAKYHTPLDTPQARKAAMMVLKSQFGGEEHLEECIEMGQKERISHEELKALWQSQRRS